jgi:hypothetical protein
MSLENIFTAPSKNTETDTYQPFTKLSETSEARLKKAADTRFKMTPVAQAICELTDKMALRAVELPESH